MKKSLSLLVASLAWAAVAGADPIESLKTADVVQAQIGCWNPAVCGDPAAYWNSLDLRVPVVEPPEEDFAPYGAPMLFDWAKDPPKWFHDAPLGPVSTPEPSSAAMLAAGLLMLAALRRR
jgi:hypothetical protein